MLYSFCLGGWNNNPSCQQFRYAFRRLLVHAPSIYSPVANVTHFSETDEEPAPVLRDDIPLTLSRFTHNVVSYMAGWIARQVADKIDCTDCRVAVFAPVSHSSLDDADAILIRIRDRGGLFFPSKDLVRVCRICETVFRQQSSPLRLKLSTFQLQVVRCMNDDLSDRFNRDDQHFASSLDGQNEHLISLLRFISKQYFFARKFHCVRLFNDKDFSKRTRFVATKSILFRCE